MADATHRNPTPEDFPVILDAIANGKSLRAICKEIGVHHSAASTAMRTDDDLASQYARAREERADYYAESILTTAQATLAGRFKPDAARVAIDAFKWTASKMAPKKYGDKVQTEHSGAVGITRLEHVIVDPAPRDDA
jgi:hypothetical protein